MTSTDRPAEQAAEIERRRDEGQQVPVFSLSTMAMAMDEIRRLRARLAEMAAEIERLREELSALKGLMQQSAQIWQTETDRCHARIAELEAIVTVGHGTMGTLVPDKPARYTHNIPPSAPPHDKPLSIIAINEATAKALEIMNEPDPDDE